MLRRSLHPSNLDQSSFLQRNDLRENPQSLHQSRLDLREESNKLMSIMKLVGLILVIVLILFWLGNPKIGNFLNIRKYLQKAKQYTKQKTEQTSKNYEYEQSAEPKDHFWNNWFNSECKLCKLDKQQQRQVVSPNLKKPS